MQINHCSNYSNKSFKGWGNYGTAIAQKGKALAQIAKTQGSDAVNQVVKMFNELDDISAHHHLYIDETKYGVFSRHLYAPSFLKSKGKKSFADILQELKTFITAENVKLDQVEKFKDKTSSVMLVHGGPVAKWGWFGDTEILKDRLITDIGLANFNSKAQKRLYRSLNRINREINKKHLFFDISEQRGELFFEIKNPKFESIFKTSTRNSNIPFLSKIPFVSKNTKQCLSNIEKFLTSQS